MEAARQSLVESGGDIELAAIAERAGVSPGLPYRYFDSKSALLVAIVDEFFDEFDEAIYRPTFEEISNDWWQRERHRLDCTVNFFYDRPLGSIILSTLAGDGDVVNAVHRRRSQQVRGASTNVRTGQSLGRVPEHIDSVLAGALLMGGVYQAVALAVGRRPKLPKSRVITQLQFFMRNVLEIEE